MDAPQLLAQWQQHLVAHSPLPTALCAAGVFLLLVPKLRRIVFDVLETVIATFLLLVLITVVLGLPFAATYIAFKGVVFTLRSISSSLPHLFNFVSVAAQQVSQHA